MNRFASEILDSLSGRIPQYKKIETYYPRFQIETHDWKQPFKEGSDNSPDEKYIRVATIHKGKQYIEHHILFKEYNRMDGNTTQEAINYLKKRIKEKINHEKKRIS